MRPGALRRQQGCSFNMTVIIPSAAKTKHRWMVRLGGALIRSFRPVGGIERSARLRGLALVATHQGFVGISPTGTPTGTYYMVVGSSEYTCGTAMAFQSL